MMPEMTRRSSTRRAPGWFLGRCGSIAAHCSSLSQKSPLMIPSISLPHQGNHDLPIAIKMLIECGP